jgi:hypothetical protein
VNDDETSSTTTSTLNSDSNQMTSLKSMAQNAIINTLNPDQLQEFVTDSLKTTTPTLQDNNSNSGSINGNGATSLQQRNQSNDLSIGNILNAAVNGHSTSVNGQLSQAGE